MFKRLVLIWLANQFTMDRPRWLCRIKNGLLRCAGVHVPNNVFIDHGFQCLSPGNITIEENVSLGHDNHIWAFTPVRIGRFTQTAKDLLLISGSHEIDSFAPAASQEIVIGPGCWIGARVTILGGVTVGKGCVIGGGALVKNSIPDWSVAVGIPARVIRKREPADQIINPIRNYSPADLED